MYLVHRRFLPSRHAVRKKGKHFKGEADHGTKPHHRTGADVYYMVKDLKVIFGKGPSRQSIPNDTNGRAPMRKKKSIFWDLPYWKDLDVRSAIDMMHVTKNLCVTLLGFLGVHRKTKRYTGGTGGPATYARKRRHTSRLGQLRSYQR